MSVEAKTGEELGYVIIRQYQPRDYGKLVSLMHESYPDYRPSGFLLDEYLVAENQNRIIGTIFCWKLTGRIELADLVVRKEFRKQGIAAALIQAAEERAANQGSENIHIKADNDELVSFYRKLGFIISDADNKIMVKPLDRTSQRI